MKPIFLAPAVVLMFAICLPLMAASAPRIACKSPVYDFGSMENSKPVEHEFSIGNTGDAVLEIGQVRACCGATATIADKVIPPGSNTALKVVYSLAGRGGRQNKSIYVGSNDAKEPYLQLQLVGNVIEALNVKPGSIDMGPLDEGVATNAEVVITGRPNLNLVVTNAVADTGVAAGFRKDASNDVWRISIKPVVIDFFYEVGCADCAKVRTQVLPELRARAEGFYTLLEHDVGERTNVALLIAYQKKLGIRENHPVLMVVDQTQAFNGFAEIERGLIAQVEKSSVARLDPEWKSAEPVAVQADSTAADSLRTFTLWMVIAGGLVDGINPCAISTLVFFMSLLSVAGVRGRGLLAMGVISKVLLGLFFLAMAVFVAVLKA